MNEVLKAIKSRRSVRAYKQQQIKQEELELIIEAGIYAPTGHNQQPWHFTVIQNPDLIGFINEKSKEIMAKVEIDWIKNLGSKPEIDITYKAPTLIIVSGRKDSISSRTDCTAAVQNMLIAAESLNIGSVWLGFAAFFFKLDNEVRKLGIPEGYEPYHVIAFGYKAAEKEQAAPKRNYDVVNYIR